MFKDCRALRTGLRTKFMGKEGMGADHGPSEASLSSFSFPICIHISKATFFYASYSVRWMVDDEAGMGV